MKKVHLTREFPRILPDMTSVPPSRRSPQGCSSAGPAGAARERSSA
jgi:hypothetical protein